MMLGNRKVCLSFVLGRMSHCTQLWGYRLSRNWWNSGHGGRL